MATDTLNTNCDQAYKYVITHEDLVEIMQQRWFPQSENATYSIVKVLPSGATVLLGTVSYGEEFFIQYNTVTITD